MEENGKSNNVYIGALKLRNIKCFKGEHIIDFMDKEGKLHQWTVILGNNNTGKTTILRAIADLEPTISVFSISSKKDNDDIRIMPYYFHRTVSIDTPEYEKYGEDFFVGCNLLIENNLNFSNSFYYKELKKLLIERIEGFTWGVNELVVTTVKNTDSRTNGIIRLRIYSYGVNRKAGNTIISDNGMGNNSSTLFDEKVELINAEEWLIQLDYAQKNNRKEATIQLEKVKQVLTSEILPDVQDFRFISDENFNNYVEFKTDYGWVRLHELGYGYRSSIAWIVDLAKKMFERYPNSDNPLEEAAVVLVDELDLHLHPEWQRKIISFLTKHFPNTQFIVTAHSPLVVQSAERVNIVLLNKEDDHVTITQPNIPTFKGWTVEEILSELMNLGERTQSDAYLQLMDDFESALDKEDFEAAQKAYDQLSAILHPNSPQRKLLRMQMSAIVHD